MTKPKYGFLIRNARTIGQERYLVEMANEPDAKPTHWTVAHQHVRNGGHHMTGLYIDHDNRVRYAKDGI